MRIVSLLAPALILCTGCAPGSPESEKGKTADCLLQQYQLPALAAAPQSDSNFDSDDDLQDLRIEIPAAVMAAHIEGYRSHVEIGSGSQPQFLYLTFSAPHESITLEQPLAEAIAEHPDLLKIPGDSQYHWDLATKTQNGLELWGECSDNFQGSYDCMTQLAIDDDTAVKYEIHQANLLVYQDVETFLLTQVTTCNLYNR